jgi:hypothetical protein
MTGDAERGLARRAVAAGVLSNGMPIPESAASDAVILARAVVEYAEARERVRGAAFTAYENRQLAAARLAAAEAALLSLAAREGGA